MGEGNETSNGGETAGTSADSVERPDGGDDSGDCDGGDRDGETDRIYHRKVTPDADEANRSLLKLLANIEDCEVTDLPPLYERIDHLVEHLFTDPPPAEAQAEMAFSYYGYRIELDQTGNVSFMKLAEEGLDPEKGSDPEAASNPEE